jgi:hypothetical protein
MSLYRYLLERKTKEELARELVALAKENAALRDRASVAEVEVFWLKVAERCPTMKEY